MIRRIKRIAPLQAGKMLGVLYAGFGLLFLPFFAIAGIFGAFAEHAAQRNSGTAALAGGVFLLMSLLFPIFYGVMGFVFGVVTAAIYNLVAGWIGGLEVEVE